MIGQSRALYTERQELRQDTCVIRSIEKFSVFDACFCASRSSFTSLLRQCRGETSFRLTGPGSVVSRCGKKLLISDRRAANRENRTGQLSRDPPHDCVAQRLILDYVNETKCPAEGDLAAFPGELISHVISEGAAWIYIRRLILFPRLNLGQACAGEKTTMRAHTHTHRVSCHNSLLFARFRVSTKRYKSARPLPLQPGISNASRETRSFL